MVAWLKQEMTIDAIQQALMGSLPGKRGQIKMAPEPPNNQMHRWDIPASCREAAVLLLLYPNQAPEPDQSPLHLILTRRHVYPGAHSGQVSFPGGRRESEESLQTTALRETMEEVGVAPESVQVLGELSSLYIPPSNFCIYPFVGYSPTTPDFRPDAKEVAELIEVPLQLLYDTSIRKQETWHFPDNSQRLIRFFDIDGHQVWGATAMILSELITLLTEES